MTARKRFFLNHKKSSAMLVSIVMHAVFIAAALSFVAVKVYIKPEQKFEGHEVKRPTMKLRKLQVPVRDKKASRAPRLRKNVVAKPRTPQFNIKLPEIVGVKGGTGYGRGEGLYSPGFGMSFNFFGLSARSDLNPHVVFIIDYSLSMKGEKDRIMRREVVRVLEDLSEGTQFGVILFAGPAWPAGDGQANSLKDWVTSSGGANTYRPKNWDDLPEVKYQPANPGRIASMVRIIESTPLVYGTVYDCPIYMALKMKPLPDTIFFMTDGACDTRRGIVSLRKMVDQLKETGQKVPVMHTVGFGISKNKQLEEMAGLMGGDSRFLTPEDYISQYGPGEVSSSDQRDEEVLDAQKAPQVSENEYPVEFNLN